MKAIILGYKRPFKHADYVSIMKEMISKKQTLEERYRKKQVNHTHTYNARYNHTEYFNNVQVYNDLSLKILGLMEKNHEYHNPRGASTKRASAMQEVKPTDRFLSTARHTVRSEYPGQDIETARRGGNRLMVPNYNSQVVKVPTLCVVCVDSVLCVLGSSFSRPEPQPSLYDEHHRTTPDQPSEDL